MSAKVFGHLTIILLRLVETFLKDELETSLTGVDVDPSLYTS